MATDLKTVSMRLKRGEGPAGALLSDSLMLENLNQTFRNVEEGTAKFNENMEAMQQHPLFRGYFKDKEKAKKKE
jgi:phospholipid/cholesterol/gamma-HCH transport system substrate-binding protein